MSRKSSQKKPPKEPATTPEIINALEELERARVDFDTALKKAAEAKAEEDKALERVISSYTCYSELMLSYEGTLPVDIDMVVQSSQVRGS